MRFRHDLAKKEEAINAKIAQLEKENREYAAEMESRLSSAKAAELRLKDEIAKLKEERKGSLSGFAQFDFKAKMIIREAEKEEEARKEFAKMIARVVHDFKTPLMMVKTSMAILEEEPLNDTGKSMTRMALRGADSLQALVDDVLICNKLEHGAIELDRKRYDLADQLRYLVNGSRKDAESKDKEISLNTEIGVFVDADPLRLERAFGNLISNAVKYGKKTVTISVRKEGSSAIVTVSDDGAGMEEKMRSKVFKGQEMMTVDLINGNGFGLTNAKRLVDMHGGNIKLVGGSTFVVTLPISQ
ncbi:Methanogenesis regulatory histidine kinase FilI [uncultured archaeon]|nr:Methanogenesis regulatory histidine kinase FilI [uncultured archaeon]